MSSSHRHRSQTYKEEPDFSRDEPPVYKLNSVVDWLDHRKYHSKVHFDKVQKVREKSIKHLEEAEKAKSEREQDWAKSKIDRL